MNIKICGSCKKEYKTEIDFLVNTSRWRLCEQLNLYFNCACGSTLLLPKGRYPWYDPQRLMKIESRSIFNELGSENPLPNLHSASQELQEVLSKVISDFSPIFRIVKNNPVLWSLILDAANIRSVAKQGVEIKKIEHAISFLGISALKDIVMISALGQLKPDTKTFDCESFWRLNRLRGALSEKIAAKVKLEGNNDEMFLAGALCNIGKLVAAFYYPKIVDLCSEAQHTRQNNVTWRQLETEYGLASHVVLGDIAVCYWGLSPAMGTYIQNHHVKPSVMPQNDNTIKIAVVALANQMTNLLGLGSRAVETALLKDLLAYLKLDEKNVVEISESLNHSLKTGS